MAPSKPWVIAHRGASVEEPDNSLPAFKKAIELGADCLEVDVHLSKDGIPVCSHDFALGPTCSLLSELSVKQIKERTEGVVPTLEQLLSLDRREVQLFIELKSEGCKDIRQLVDKVLELVAFYAHFSPEPPLIGSFSQGIVSELSRGWPKERLVGIAEYARDMDILLALHPGYIALDSKLVTSEIVDRVKGQNTEVWSWTVDDSERARLLVRMGVSGIITNNPRLMLEAGLGDPGRLCRR